MFGLERNSEEEESEEHIDRQVGFEVVIWIGA